LHPLESAALSRRTPIADVEWNSVDIQQPSQKTARTTIRLLLFVIPPSIAQTDGELAETYFERALAIARQQQAKS
jgi:hypothetical protein